MWKQPPHAFLIYIYNVDNYLSGRNCFLISLLLQNYFIYKSFTYENEFFLYKKIIKLLRVDVTRLIKHMTYVILRWHSENDLFNLIVLNSFSFTAKLHFTIIYYYVKLIKIIIIN